MLFQLKISNTVCSGDHALGGKRGVLEVFLIACLFAKSHFQIPEQVGGHKTVSFAFLCLYLFFAVSLSSFSSSMVCRAPGSSSASSSLMRFSTPLGVVVNVSYSSAT